MRKWKLGIVGCGGAMLCIHLPALQALYKYFKIKAICDVDENRLNFAANRIGDVKKFLNIEEMLLEDIDMVLVLSLNHENFIEKSLIAKKHVFTEKPISLSLGCSKKLYNLALSNNLLLEVGLMRFFDKAIIDFNKKFDVKSVISGLLFKIDGSDKVIRDNFFLKSISSYSFHFSDPPILPKDLGTREIMALKILLWSGVHLLTYLFKFVDDDLIIDSCFMNKDGSMISCNFITQSSQHFNLILTNTSVPIYDETVKLITDKSIGNFSFSSPYLNGMNTQSSMYSKNRSDVKMSREFTYESSFISMWKSINLALNNKKNTGTLKIAIKIEEFARKIAAMVNAI